MFNFVAAELIKSEVTNLNSTIIFYKKCKDLLADLAKDANFAVQKKELEKFLIPYEEIYKIVGNDATNFLESLKVENSEKIAAESNLLKVAKSIVHMTCCQPFLALCGFRQQALKDSGEFNEFLKNLINEVIPKDWLIKYKYVDFEIHQAAVLQRFPKYELLAKEIEKILIAEVKTYFEPKAFEKTYKEPHLALQLLNSAQGAKDLKSKGLSNKSLSNPELDLNQSVKKLQLFYHIATFIGYLGKIYSSHYNSAKKLSENADIRALEPDYKNPIYIASTMLNETNNALNKLLTESVDAVKKQNECAEEIKSINKQDKGSKQDSRILKKYNESNEKIRDLKEKVGCYQEDLVKASQTITVHFRKQIDEIKEYEDHIKQLSSIAKFLLKLTYQLLGEQEIDFEKKDIAPYKPYVPVETKSNPDVIVTNAKVQKSNSNSKEDTDKTLIIESKSPSARQRFFTEGSLPVKAPTQQVNDRKDPEIASASQQQIKLKHRGASVNSNLSSGFLKPAKISIQSTGGGGVKIVEVNQDQLKQVKNNLNSVGYEKK